MPIAPVHIQTAPRSEISLLTHNAAVSADDLRALGPVLASRSVRVMQPGVGDDGAGFCLSSTACELARLKEGDPILDVLPRRLLQPTAMQDFALTGRGSRLKACRGY